jgi:hypothetical protein
MSDTPEMIEAKLCRAQFALETLSLIVRQGDGVSPANKLARVKSVVREAQEDIEGMRPSGDMFEVRNVAAR